MHPAFNGLAGRLICFLVMLWAIPVRSAKFPVSIRRELGGNALNLFVNAGLHRPHRPQAAKFPCIFPQNRDYQPGDGFADDCLHRQGPLVSNGFLAFPIFSHQSVHHASAWTSARGSRCHSRPRSPWPKRSQRRQWCRALLATPTVPAPYPIFLTLWL